MALTRHQSRDAVAEEMYFFDSADGLPQADQYGLLEMGYVRPSATGRGIGTQLLREIERLGSAHDVEWFVSDAWYHGGTDSPRRLFEHNGYDTIRTTPFTPSSEVCPKCGPDCRCEGAIVVKQAER
jgi:Acetyltransferase (GNAT) family.